MIPENGLTQDFEIILREQWSRIHGVLYRLTGDSAESEDLALEVFWRLYKRNHDSRLGNLEGWIYRVAVNLGLNALRARKRRLKHEHAAGCEAVEAANARGGIMEQDCNDQRRLVRRTLGRMKPRDSQLLIMRHSGLAYAEIASLLKVSIHSVGTMLARAEKDFEKHYHKLEGE